MRTFSILASATACCFVGVAACGDARPLVSRDAGIHASARRDAGVDAGTDTPFVEITLTPGQTLWDLARAYGVTVKEIRDFNELTPWAARHVHAGQSIRIPGVDTPIESMDDDPDDAGVDGAVDDLVAYADDAGEPDGGEPEAPLTGGYHTIADGETLWDLARMYDRTLDDLERANQWDDDDASSIVTGTRVLIPGVPQSRIHNTAARRESTPRWGLHHEMARGESIWTLAQRYEVSVAEIMAANHLTPSAAQNLSLGQSVLIPGVIARPDASQRERPRTPLQQRAMQLAHRLGLGTRAAAQQLLHGHVQPRWIAAAGGRRSRLPGTLRWPVANGRFSRGYGSGEGGYHLATDIMGDIGWNVRAAAPGIVGYSGRELTGFGNVVLVVHPGGWVTLYGHNSVNFVVAGQRVRAGTILAEVGSTGRSTGPHVHFELIYDGMNCNPNGLFRPGIRHRNGYGRIVQVTWTVPRDRPDSVSCAPRRRHPSHDLPANE